MRHRLKSVTRNMMFRLWFRMTTSVAGFCAVNLCRPDEIPPRRCPVIVIIRTAQNRNAPKSRQRWLVGSSRRNGLARLVEGDTVPLPESFKSSGTEVARCRDLGLATGCCVSARLVSAVLIHHKQPTPARAVPLVRKYGPTAHTSFVFLPRPPRR